MTDELREHHRAGPVTIDDACMAPTQAPAADFARLDTLTRPENVKAIDVSAIGTQDRTIGALALLEMLQAEAPVGFGYVDLDFRIVELNERLARINGGSADQLRGHLVSDVVPELWPQLEAVYRGVAETGIPVINLEVSGETAEDPGQCHYWLASYYPVRTTSRIIGVGILVLDITERKRGEQARADLTHAAVAAIAAATGIRDPYTAGHQRRVARIAEAVGVRLGLDANEIEGIKLAASIHDIGKLAIPAEILSRPGRLSPIEVEIVKAHSRAGHDIVAGIAFPWPVAAMILEHHERLDGSGYPDQRRGDEIQLGARIIAVADVLEAMASPRPYRSARGVDAALQELIAGRGSLYDQTAIDACLAMHAEGRLSPLLSTG